MGIYGIKKNTELRDINYYTANHGLITKVSSYTIKDIGHGEIYSIGSKIIMMLDNEENTLKIQH